MVTYIQPLKKTIIYILEELFLDPLFLKKGWGFMGNFYLFP